MTIARGDTINRVKAAATKDKVAFAQEQRHEMTHGEKLLWQALRNRKLGVKFRRQHPIADFILDFYCEAARLAAEVDGPHHADRLAYDRMRDEMLSELGIEVLRLSADDVVRDLPTQLLRIVALLSR